MTNPLTPNSKRPISPEHDQKSGLDLSDSDGGKEESPSTAARINQVATVVLVLNIVFFIGFVVSLLLGWVSLSTGSNKAGATQIVLSISTSEVSEDVGRSLDEAGKMTQSFVTATEQESAQGRIGSVNLENNTMTLLTQENTKLTLAITGITDVEVEGEESPFRDLSKGQTARVIYKENDGELFALTVKQFDSATSPEE